MARPRRRACVAADEAPGPHGDHAHDEWHHRLPRGDICPISIFTLGLGGKLPISKAPKEWSTRMPITKVTPPREEE